MGCGGVGGGGIEYLNKKLTDGSKDEEVERMQGVSERDRDRDREMER